METLKFFRHLMLYPLLHYYITIIQIPIVLCLAFQSLQAYKLNFKEFKWIFFAWCFNGCYLLVNVLLTNAGFDFNDSLIIRTSADLLCMTLFLFAVIDSFENKPFRYLRKISKLLIVCFIIFAGIAKSIPGSLHLVPFIHVRYIPAAFFDFCSLFLVAQYFKAFAKKFGQKQFLFYVTLFYAVIQFLWVFEVDQPDKDLILLKIDNVGFALGLASKIGILISLSILLISVVEFTAKGEKEKLLRKLTFTTNILNVKNLITNKTLEEQENNILESILNECLMLLEVQLGYFAFYDKKNKNIKITYASDKYASQVDYVYSDSEGITGKAVVTKKIQIKDTVNDAPEYFKFSRLTGKRYFTIVDNDVKSAVAIPVVLDDEVLGIYMFESENENYFTLTDINILNALVSQAATAIKNIHLVQELELSKTLLDSLMEIDRVMTDNTLELENILEFILSQSLKLAKCELGNIALKSKNNDELVIVAEATERNNKNTRYKINESISGKAVMEKRTIYIPDIALADNTTKRLYKNFLGNNLICELAVPLIVNNNVIGVFNTESSTPDNFSKNDREKVQGFATQAAIAIHIFQLFEQVKKHKNSLNTLAEIELLILSSESLTKTLDEILKRGLFLIQKNHAEILLVDKSDSNEGNLIIKKSTVTDEVDIILPLKSKSISAIAIKKQKIVYLPYIDKVEENPIGFNLNEIYFPTEDEKASYHVPLSGKMKSELVLPLILKDKIIGVLNIESDEYDDFRPDEIHLLKNLALVSAIAIHNAQQFEKIRNINKELINSVDKEKVQMASILGKVINHRIGNSVGTIRTILKDKLLNGRYGKFDQKVTDAFQDMLISAEKVINARREISEKLESLLTAKPMLIDFKKIKTAIEKSDELNIRSDVSITIIGFENLSPVLFNLDLFLEAIVFELIRNANKAMPKGGEISIIGEIENDEVIIAFSDTGCGISQENIDNIFNERFSHWQSGKGTGLGLFELKTALEFFRGQIDVKSKIGAGTTFFIKLPIIDFDSFSNK